MANKFFEKIINTKTRTLVVLTIGILITGVAVALIAANKRSPASASVVSKTPTINSVPGNVVSEKYQQLQEEDNKRRAEKALQSGESAVPTLIGTKAQDNLSKKELFGVEDKLTAKKDCNCKDELDPAKAAELMAQIKANPALAAKLLKENPGLAKYLAENDPALLKQLMLNDPEVAKLLAKTNPDIVKDLMLSDPKFAEQFGSKHPELVKELMRNDLDFARTLAKQNPELVKKYMRDDPVFAAIMGKQNPDMVKELMLNDPEFARDMARNNPDMVRELMQKDPVFAKNIEAKVPGISKMLPAPSNPERSRVQAIDEARRLQLNSQQEAQRQYKLNELQQKQLNALLANMETQSKSIYQAWNDVSPQLYVQGDLGKEDGGTTNREGAGIEGSDNKAVLFKAGTILFATLDTSVNTDEPGPVLATIVAGKYKGAKLMGNMEFNNGKGGNAARVLLNFNLLNLPTVDKSIQIAAVAVDPDNARTALASDIDNHYLLRYGTLMASAFMSGYSKVITQQGTVQVTSPATGSTTVTTPPLTGRKEIFAALGEVGKQWSDAVKENVNRPPTVTVDAGTGIGLLFTKDVEV